MAVENRMSSTRQRTPASSRAFDATLIGLFIVTVLLPEEASFFVGSLRLTVARALLIGIAPILILRFMLKLSIRPIASDILMLVAAFWMLLANSVVQGLDHAITSTGILVVEFLFSYMLARTFTQDDLDVTSAVRIFCIGVSAVSVVAAIDTLSGAYVVHGWFSKLTGNTDFLNLDFRMGVLRAAGTLDHPILLGTVCSMSILMSTALTSADRWIIRMLSFMGLLCSLSSGPLGAMVLGLALLSYGAVSRNIPNRWTMVAVLVGLMVSVIFLISKDPLNFVLSTFTFDKGTAFFRVLIWQYGMINVYAHPVFGIGLNTEWVREEWMPNSVDSFWLLTTMTYGFPGLILIAGGWIAAFLSGNQDVRPEAAKLQTALNVTMMSIVYVGFTVHFWGPTYMLISFLAGLRATLAADRSSSAATLRYDVPKYTVAPYPQL